jgi:hypothetical protein
MDALLGGSAKSAHADAWSASSRDTRAIGFGSMSRQDLGADRGMRRLE